MALRMRSQKRVSARPSRGAHRIQLRNAVGIDLDAVLPHLQHERLGEVA